MDFMYAAEAQAYQGFWEGNEAFLQQYLVLLYTGFYIFGVGEVVPRSDSLEFFSGFILCSVCTIANAVIIGYMTSYTEELNKKSAEMGEKLNLINTAMLNLKLSSNLKGQITEYIYQTHSTQKLQAELSNFMGQISPVYKKKVTKESFKELVHKNQVFKQICESHVAQKKKELSKRLEPNQFRLYKKREEDKCITQLVVKLISIFTAPDLDFLRQEDEVCHNPQPIQEEEGVEEKPQPFMFFIKNGKFSVHVKTDHLNPEAMSVGDDRPKPV